MTTCNAAAVSTLAKATHTALICARHFALVQCDRTARRPTDHGPIRLDRDDSMPPCLCQWMQRYNVGPMIDATMPPCVDKFCQWIRGTSGPPSVYRGSTADHRGAIHGYAITLADTRSRGAIHGYAITWRIRDHAGRSTDTRSPRSRWRIRDHRAIHGYAITAITLADTRSPRGDPRIRDHRDHAGGYARSPRGDPRSRWRIRDHRGAIHGYASRWAIHGYAITRSRWAIHGYAIAAIHEYAITLGDPRMGRSTDTRFAAVHMACHGYAIAAIHMRVHEYAIAAVHMVSHMGIRDAGAIAACTAATGRASTFGTRCAVPCDDARSADARVGFSTYGTRCAVPS